MAGPCPGIRESSAVHGSLNFPTLLKVDNINIGYIPYHPPTRTANKGERSSLYMSEQCISAFKQVQTLALRTKAHWLLRT